MAIIQSTDFDPNLKVRSVEEAFQLLLTDNRSILGTLMQNGVGYKAGSNQKYEWTESTLSPLKFSVNGASNALVNPNTSTITFDSTTGMKEGMYLSFKTSTGNDVVDANGDQIVVYVASTTATTAVVYLLPGLLATTVPDNSIASFTEAVKENKKDFDGENDREPTQEYNAFQIFDQQVELSDTVMNSLMYADPNMMANQLTQAMFYIQQKMQVAVSTGRRLLRGTTIATGLTSNGTLGSYKSFIDVATGNRIDAASSAINQTLINDAMQAILEKGGTANTIVCNYDKARAISAFNTSGNNPIIMLDRGNTVTGSYVQQFAFDMPVEGGLISKIVIDDKMSNNQLYLTDINRIAVVPFANRGMRLIETTANGQDGRSMILRGEYTLVVKDAKSSHAVIKNLI